MDEDQRLPRHFIEPARQTGRQVSRWRGDYLTIVVTGSSDRIDQVDQIAGRMLALPGKSLIAAPIDRHIEPGEQVAMVKPGEVPRAGVLQDGARFGMLAQIDREIELLGEQALAQLLPVLLRQIEFAQRGARVEEIELDRLRNARLERPHRQGGARGQDGNPAVRETLMQPPQRRERDDAVADMAELDQQAFADLVSAQYLPTGHQHMVR